MSCSSKSLDVSFLKGYGYKFDSNVKRNSQFKAEFGDEKLTCKIVSKKKKVKDDKADIAFLETLKHLLHPNLARIHSIVQSGSLTFVFMPWIDGGTLLSYIQQHGMINESTARFWFYQLFCAVRYLHAMGFAHCNLTCDNVIISGKTVKILGLDQIQQCTNEVKLHSKHVDSMPAFYLSPEINKGLQYDASKADVYALGTILFMMLNATIPTSNFTDKSQLIDDQMKRRFQMRTSNIRKLSVDCQVMIHVLLEPDDAVRWSLNQILKMKWIASYVEKQGDS